MTDTLHDKLRAFLTADILRDSSYPLGDDDALITSGLIDSFSLVDIAMWIENISGARVDGSDLTNANVNTLAEMVTFVERLQKL